MFTSPTSLAITGFTLSAVFLLNACDFGSHSHDHQKDTKVVSEITKPSVWSVTKKSDQQHYSVTLTCAQKPTVGGFQSCLVSLSSAGQAVSDATISIDGGMRAHGHGLPTSPKMISTQARGEYKIEGLKFSMTGEWVLGFKVQT